MSVIEHTIEHQIQDLLQVSRIPRNVETTAVNIENNFKATADNLIATAEKIEIKARKLREKAEWLLTQIALANELRQAVVFERIASEEVASLALVDVGIRDREHD